MQTASIKQGTARSAAGTNSIWRAPKFPERPTSVERRADGSLILRCEAPLRASGKQGLPDFLRDWAQRRGNAIAFAERDAAGAWRTLSWTALWQQVRSVGAALLELGLDENRPLMLLSGNSVEQAVVLLAAEYAGVPTAPVSPAYSLVSKDFVRLKSVVDLVPPAAVFVQDAAQFARALGDINAHLATRVPVIAVNGAANGQIGWTDLVRTELTVARREALAAARANIDAGQTGRVLFTSGSTGIPKGVALSYGNMQTVADYYADMFRALVEPQPVFLDWLPWHHGLGGLLNFTRTITLGGAYYIDDGRPLPGQFERTVRNLREISPTVLTSVPSAWSMLVGELERDPELARSVFAHVMNFSYGGASLPGDVRERIEIVAERTVGERITFCSGLGCTETSGMGVFCSWPTDAPGNVGVPMPGAEVKLVPLEGGDGRYDIRMRGPFVFAGYIKRPDLTAAAFDDEGYYRLGDAVRLAVPGDPTGGLQFAGRVAEDFKLGNGTWVLTGAVRLGLVERCAPLLNDAIICGHDRGYVTALAWPNLNACRALAPELAELDAQALVTHPLVIEAIRARVGAAHGTGASVTVKRVMLMAEPPSMDAGEISDKGYVNQAIARTRRAHLVEALYRSEPAPHVACMS
ncbi:feruloyl-CoA synthase [Caballeronia sp. J97]|uniref:feruloyl-CoA synthase n=1 Tax=Caballeronia sp. J97 TaxID=2805429 RepID=UPI002AB23DDC|nr:feruloyl-CoA synthase [Caballeronia sp. J97]